ncbi:hypothetical protein C8R44DRAFT_862903 [Mycena epipterygia]|nr:hypothetical protein C8R44DRAFT_862903 [Mycena epipterygia]
MYEAEPLGRTHEDSEGLRFEAMVELRKNNRIAPEHLEDSDHPRSLPTGATMRATMRLVDRLEGRVQRGQRQMESNEWEKPRNNSVRRKTSYGRRILEQKNARTGEKCGGIDGMKGTAQVGTDVAVGPGNISQNLESECWIFDWDVATTRIWGCTAWNEYRIAWTLGYNSEILGMNWDDANDTGNDCGVKNYRGLESNDLGASDECVAAGTIEKTLYGAVRIWDIDASGVMGTRCDCCEMYWELQVARMALCAVFGRSSDAKPLIISISAHLKAQIPNRRATTIGHESNREAVIVSQPR